MFGLYGEKFILESRTGLHAKKIQEIQEAVGNFINTQRLSYVIFKILFINFTQIKKSFENEVNNKYVFDNWCTL